MNDTTSAHTRPSPQRLTSTDADRRLVRWSLLDAGGDIQPETAPQRSGSRCPRTVAASTDGITANIVTPNYLGYPICLGIRGAGTAPLSVGASHAMPPTIWDRVMSRSCSRPGLVGGAT